MTHQASSVNNSPSVAIPLHIWTLVSIKDLRIGDDGTHCSSVCPFLSSFAPKFFLPSSLFSLMCTLLASCSCFVHDPKNLCYLLSSLIQQLHDEQFLITRALCRSQNMRTNGPRGAVGLRLYPLRWSASASLLLPACATASNVNNDLYFRTRSLSHLAFEPQSSNPPLRRQRPLQWHSKGPSIRKSARLPVIGPFAFWEECRVQ